MFHKAIVTEVGKRGSYENPEVSIPFHLPGVACVALASELLGLEITSLLWILVLAFVADAVQRIVWRLVAKPIRV